VFEPEPHHHHRMHDDHSPVSEEIPEGGGGYSSMAPSSSGLSSGLKPYVLFDKDIAEENYVGDNGSVFSANNNEEPYFSIPQPAFDRVNSATNLETSPENCSPSTDDYSHDSSFGVQVSSPAPNLTEEKDYVAFDDAVSGNPRNLPSLSSILARNINEFILPNPEEGEINIQKNSHVVSSPSERSHHLGETTANAAFPNHETGTYITESDAMLL